jgi:hypothetical protein
MHGQRNVKLKEIPFGVNACVPRYNWRGYGIKFATDYDFKRNSLSCGDFSEAGLSY